MAGARLPVGECQGNKDSRRGAEIATGMRENDIGKAGAKSGYHSSSGAWAWTPEDGFTGSSWPVSYPILG